MTVQPPASTFSAGSITTSPESSWPNGTTHHASACSKDCTFKDVQSQRYSWTKCQGTSYVGKVHIIIDKATNKTITSTSSYQDYITYPLIDQVYTTALSDIVKNGVSILSRTDVNAAGTVTYVVTDYEPPHNVMTYTYPTAQVKIEKEYEWNGIFPYTQDGSATCVQAATGTKTPLPSISSMPTSRLQEMDPADEAGWTYCYQPFADFLPANETFYSLFDDLDDIFVAVSNYSNCDRSWIGAGPVKAVSQVAFLFEETTSYINDPATTQTSITSTSSGPLLPSSVLVDPFGIDPQSTSTEASLQSSSARAKETLPSSEETPHSEKPTIFETKTDSQAHIPATASSALPFKSDDNDVPGNTHAPPAGSDGLNTEASSPSLIAAYTGTNRNVEPSASASTGNMPLESLNPPTTTATESANNAASPASLKPASSPLETLNSLINVIAAGQSSSATRQGVHESKSAGIVHFTPPKIGTSTISTNSAGQWVIGSHTMPLEGSSYHTDGVTYAWVSDGGVPTVLEITTSSAPHPDATHPPFSTFGDVTATANAATEYVFGDQTLVPGSFAIELSGTSISLAQGATAVVFGSETVTVANPASTDTAQVLTVDGVALTAIAVGSETASSGASSTASILTTSGTGAAATTATEYLIAGQTLQAGASPITVSGTGLSLASDATAIVIGSETKNLESTKGVGDYVWAGIAGVLSSAQSSSATAPELTVTSTASSGDATSGTKTDSSSTPSDAFEGSSSRIAGTSVPGTDTSDLSIPSSSSSSATEFANHSASRPCIAQAALVLTISVLCLIL